jgi:hypothetical protein
VSKAAETTTLTLTNKQQLYKIIVDSRGNPDALAINLYWDEFRSWYNHKKIHTSSKIVKIPKLYKYGVYASYKELSKKYGVTKDTIRRKIVELEKLGLLSRDFYKNLEGRKALYNQLIIYIWQQTPCFFNPIGLDRTLIEELTPSTNHEYISSKYHNENKGECEQNQYTPLIEFKDTPLLTNKDTPYTEIKDIITQENKDTHVPLQASSFLGLEVEGGILTNQHTPLLTGKDTNILRVNNLYNEGIERLFTVYNNTTHARGFNNKTCVTDCANKNNDTNTPVDTNSAEIKTLNIEEKKSGYADLAFGFLTEPTQSAVDEWEETETEELAALLDNDCITDPVVPIDPEEIVADEQATRRMLLSKALWSTFGEQRSGEIQDDYKFVETEPHKVCIQTEKMQLNDIEKAKIRKCIQSVYGEDVTIAMQIIAPLQNEPIPSDEVIELEHSGSKLNWLNFKSVIKNHSLFAALNNPSLTITEESPKKIIIEGVAFLIERIIEPGSLEDLEDAILKTGLTLELCTKNVHPEYKNFEKQPIILTAEKVLEDKAWLSNIRIAELLKSNTTGRLIEVREEKPVNDYDSESVTNCSRLKLTAREEAIVNNFNDMELLALIEKQASQA